MFPFRVIFKEIVMLIVKIVFVGAILYGMWWFLQEGNVVVEKGKEHGVIPR